MPELPEVETLRLGLQKYLIGHTIRDIDVRLRKIFYGSPNDIIGAKFVRIKRFGKGLVLELNNGYSLAIHIKLTGQLIYQGPDIPATSHISQLKVGSLPNNWTHVIFHLDKGSTLYYNDLRQFGWIKVVKTDQIKELPFFKELGPEPAVAKAMAGQAILTEEKFSAVVAKAKGPIKPLLMDQKKIGGIGNIYANDALFAAKILPTRPASSLSSEEIARLFHAIERVLKKGLQEGGASELTYVNALGEMGNYQKHFLVYGREDEPCRVCKTPIKKITLGGRGTYYCPKCQK